MLVSAWLLNFPSLNSVILISTSHSIHASAIPPCFEMALDAELFSKCTMDMKALSRRNRLLWQAPYLRGLIPLVDRAGLAAAKPGRTRLNCPLVLKPCHASTAAPLGRPASAFAKLEVPAFPACMPDQMLWRPLRLVIPTHDCAKSSIQDCKKTHELIEGLAAADLSKQRASILFTGGRICGLRNLWRQSAA